MVRVVRKIKNKSNHRLNKSSAWINFINSNATSLGISTIYLYMFYQLTYFLRNLREADSN